MTAFALIPSGFYSITGSRDCQYRRLAYSTIIWALVSAVYQKHNQISYFLFLQAAPDCQYRRLASCFRLNVWDFGVLTAECMRLWCLQWGFRLNVWDFGVLTAECMRLWCPTGYSDQKMPLWDFGLLLLQAAPDCQYRRLASCFRLKLTNSKSFPLQAVPYLQYRRLASCFRLNVWDFGVFCWVSGWMYETLVSPTRFLAECMRLWCFNRVPAECMRFWCLQRHFRLKGWDFGVSNSLQLKMGTYESRWRHLLSYLPVFSRKNLKKR